MSPRVDLLADGGAATAAPQFFRCETFLRAEGVSHSLVIETTEGRVVLPVLVRPIPGGHGWDAISPYGYPGGSLEGTPPDPRELDFSVTGLVSLFVRDRVDAPTLRGGIKRSCLLLHDPSRSRRLRDTFAYQARRNARRGYAVELIPGRQVDDATLEAFADAYEQTMHRADAADRYFFSLGYLRGCLEFEQSWLVVTHASTGELAAGLIAAVSDGVLHYYLGGTADRHRAASPAKNGFVRLLDLADELGVPLNLGGGLTPGDGLEVFKRGFANAERSFTTHEVVCDREAYAVLSRGHGSADFFPAYRAP